MYRNRTTIPYEGTYSEHLLEIQWPKWAIDEVNKLISEGISQRKACEILAKRVREETIKEKANAVSN
jgi:uncharacterized protein YoaH (UPF0181 family)